MSDKIMAGEMVLIEFSEKEREAAKARLEASTEMNRRYRQNNIEKVRAKDRKRYKKKASA